MLTWQSQWAVAILLVIGAANTEPVIPREQTIPPNEGSIVRNSPSSERGGMAGADVQAGKKLLEKYCVTCHGSGDKGDGARILGAEVADLSSPSSQRKLDDDLLKTIHEGRSGKAMPS